MVIAGWFSRMAVTMVLVAVSSSESLTGKANHAGIKQRPGAEHRDTLRTEPRGPMLLRPLASHRAQSNPLRLPTQTRFHGVPHSFR